MASEKRHVASEYTHQMGWIEPEGCRYDDVYTCERSWNLAGHTGHMVLTDKRKSTHPVTLAIFNQELGQNHREEQALQGIPVNTGVSPIH